MIDYALAYTDVQNAEFDTFEAGVTTTEWIATNLTPGSTYKFKVRARNAFGYSDYSEEIEILAA